MIRIIADSGCDYLSDEIEKRKIETVPLQLRFGGKDYLDGVDLKRERFFEMLLAGKDFPVTSQPSPAAFLELFEKAKEKGDDVVCVLISSALSGTYQSAQMAKQIADYERIYLVDSKSASIGIQYLLDRACKLRDEGQSAACIQSELERLKSRICVYFLVDTLEYLHRGGRLSRSGMLAGELVKMKPVLSLDKAGSVGVSDLSLGISRAMRAIIRHLKQIPMDEAFPLYSLFSVGTENAEKLEEKLIKEGFAFQGRKQIGAAIGAHIGPGAAGIFYIKEAGGKSQ